MNCSKGLYRLYCGYCTCARATSYMRIISRSFSENEKTRYRTSASDLSETFQLPYNDKLAAKFGGSKKNLKYESFTDFEGLHPLLIAKLKDLGYDVPLPVQRDSLLATLAGKDVVIKSVTGSGKTLAFVLPLLNRIIATQVQNSPRAIIVAPTRELCTQISSVIKSLVDDSRVTNMTGGGVKVKKQIKHGRNTSDIIVATPGRIMQIVSMNLIRPQDLKFLVLDEADVLLNDIFYRNLRWILDNSSNTKQMIVTSATIPQNLQFIVDRYMKYHHFIDVGYDVLSTPDQIKHKAVLYNHKVFDNVIKWVLQNEHNGCSMVFVKYREKCQPLSEYIRTLGYTTRFINSQIPQSGRTKIMESFKRGDFEVLVTTDISMRGVDVPSCDLIVQIRPDLNITKFVHRSGRTGRNGRPGTSVLLLSQNQAQELEFLEECSTIVDFQYYKFGVHNLEKLRRK